MRVVLYLRFSSAKQNEQSIEGQDRVCCEFCAREGHEIIERYIDRAASASKDIEKREAFLKMISDSANQDFDAVVVYKLDRFSRNRYDSAIYRAKLKKNGVRLLSATENLTDSPESIILESMLEGMAEYYSQELRQKVKRGMHESALKGSYNGGAVPYGYRIIDKTYVIDDIQAPVVREIYERVANGERHNKILASLNERGLRTRSGAKWNTSSFNVILHNIRYTGTYRFEDVEIPDAIPAIIDRELYDRVQAVTARNKHAPVQHSGAGADYWLTGKLFCGHCGEGMIGESGTDKKGQTHYYYVCRKVKSRRGCNKKRVKKDAIENAIYEDCLTFLNTDTMVDIAQRAVEASRSSSNEKAISDIGEQIKTLTRKATALVDTIAMVGASKEASEKLIEINEQREQLEAEQERLRNAGPALELNDVLMWLIHVRDQSVQDEEFKQQFVNLLVNAVYVYDDPDGQYIKIAYNLTGYTTDPIPLSAVERASPADGYSSVLQYGPPSSIYSNRALLIRERRV